MDAAARLIPPRLPLATLLICGVAGAVMALPRLQSGLIYSRDAIGAGETWRLVTGNLVHLSPSHLFCDVVPFLVFGTLLERRHAARFALLCLVSAALIGVSVYALEPEILVFGGLSGVVTAAVTSFCLHGLGEPGARRWIYAVGLLCLLMKIAVELASGSSFLLAAGPGEDFVPVPLSHAVGAVAAFILFALGKRLQASATPPSLPCGG